MVLLCMKKAVIQHLSLIRQPLQQQQSVIWCCMWVLCFLLCLCWSEKWSHGQSVYCIVCLWEDDRMTAEARDNSKCKREIIDNKRKIEINKAIHIDGEHVYCCFFMCVCVYVWAEHGFKDQAGRDLSICVHTNPIRFTLAFYCHAHNTKYIWVKWSKTL